MHKNANRKHWERVLMVIRTEESPVREWRLRRDPEDRSIRSCNEAAIREKMLDKTLADTYPASDPLSSIPDPSSDSLSAGDQVGRPSLDRAA